jgi:hypothetical protein
MIEKQRRLRSWPLEAFMCRCGARIGPPLAAGLERFRLSDDGTRAASLTPAIVPQQESERSGIDAGGPCYPRNWGKSAAGSRCAWRRRSGSRRNAAGAADSALLLSRGPAAGARDRGRRRASCCAQIRQWRVTVPLRRRDREVGQQQAPTVRSPAGSRRGAPAGGRRDVDASIGTWGGAVMGGGADTVLPFLPPVPWHGCGGGWRCLVGLWDPRPVFFRERCCGGGWESGAAVGGAGELQSA